MSQLRLTRRQALMSAAAAAVAACAPGGTSASPTPAGSAAATARAAVPFKFLFGFTVQANPSMPVIVAKELGYYKEEGVDIAWDFTTDSTSIRLIGTNQYNAGSVSDVLTVANFVKQGIPLVAMVQQGQDSARVFAVKQGSPIKRPKDFEGKKVGVKPGAPWTEYLAMLAFDKVDRSKITEVPVGFSSVELKDGLVDVLPTFIGNEPFVLKTQLNTPVDLILPKDFGAPLVGTTMVANKDFIKNNRDAMVRFLKATMKAQEYFIANKAETVQMAVQYGGTATTRAQHEYIYDISQKDMQHPNGVGWIDKAKWQANLDIITSLGLIKDPPKIDDLVDDSLMKEIIGADKKIKYP
ncbi:MAG TPA: ABC transporter substrate-binding protein [Candidatus Limnocylindria bacterium]|jgi:NitT/TauT family transport system substrate-binding protein|nr:ABC transporter substrate-binding protein [Candidatus Limnocylindria bacterium]